MVGAWFSPGTPASSTTKTGRHDIAEILLKVALNTKNQIKSNQILIVENRNVDSLVVFVFLSRFKIYCKQLKSRLSVKLGKFQQTPLSSIANESIR
jgi:hypothetical protein